MERLLSALTGIVSAYVVTDSEGRPTEIHVLATPDLLPKQVVRNVESALSAGMGIQIDRRIVSVAQVRPGVGWKEQPGAAEQPEWAEHPEVDAPEQPEARRGAGAEPARESERQATVQSGTSRPGETPRQARSVLVAFDAQSDRSRLATCRVTLQLGARELTASGEGADTPQGRAEAAARATLAAATEATGCDDLGLEGLALTQAHGRSYVLVAARGRHGRESVPLTGLAAIRRSPEEAAIFASLQAINRWAARPSTLA